MRKWSFIFAAVILLGTILAMTLGGGTRRHEPGLAFICFTNTPEGTEALFWFTNSPSLKFGWGITEISRITSTGAVHETETTNCGRVSHYTPMLPTGVPEPAFADLDLIGIRVPSTNEPWRFLIECYEPGSRWKQFKVWLDEKHDSFRQGRKVEYSSERSYSLTGETTPTPVRN